MGEWQPISTAPKDETPVLCWHPDNGVAVMIYTGERPKRLYKWGWEFCRASNFWPTAQGERHRPTHWMPLPGPPPMNPSSSDAGSVRDPIRMMREAAAIAAHQELTGFMWLRAGTDARRAADAALIVGLRAFDGDIPKCDIGYLDGRHALLRLAAAIEAQARDDAATVAPKPEP